MRLTKEHLAQFRDIQFVYGGGLQYVASEDSQDDVCWNEPNTLLIPTCFKSCKLGRADYMFYDYMFPVVLKELIDVALSKIKPYSIYLPKIGQGCSHLNKRCPKTYKYIIKQLNQLCLNSSLKKGLCLPTTMNSMFSDSPVTLNRSWTESELSILKAICTHGEDTNTVE